MKKIQLASEGFMNTANETFMNEIYETEKKLDKRTKEKHLCITIFLGTFWHTENTCNNDAASMSLCVCVFSLHVKAQPE